MNTGNIGKYSNKGFKKTKYDVKQVNEQYLNKLDKNATIEVEMWNYYGSKNNQVWLRWAIDHNTHTSLAFTFGTREHKYLDELINLLNPFNIKTVFSDNNFSYKDKISEKVLATGKKNTQVIERHHLTLGIAKNR